MKHPAVILFNDIALYLLLALIVCASLPVAILILLALCAIDVVGRFVPARELHR